MRNSIQFAIDRLLITGLITVATSSILTIPPHTYSISGKNRHGKKYTKPHALLFFTQTFNITFSIKEKTRVRARARAQLFNWKIYLYPSNNMLLCFQVYSLAICALDFAAGKTRASLSRINRNTSHWRVIQRNTRYDCISRGRSPIESPSTMIVAISFVLLEKGIFLSGMRERRSYPK